MGRAILLLSLVAVALLLASGVALAAAGDLDATFGGDGRVDIDFGYEFDYVWSLALQPDGKVVAGGTSAYIPEGRFALARYLP